MAKKSRDNYKKIDATKPMEKSRVVFQLRSNFVLIAFTAIILLISFRSFYLQVLQKDFFREMVIEQVESYKKLQIEQIGKKIKNKKALIRKIKTRFDTLEKLSLGEIKTVLFESINLINQLEDDHTLLQLRIFDLEKQINRRYKHLSELKKELNNLKNITESERNELRALFYEVAKKESLINLWTGLIISFFLGIVASLIGSYVYKIIEKRIVHFTTD